MKNTKMSGLIVLLAALLIIGTVSVNGCKKQSPPPPAPVASESQAQPAAPAVDAAKWSEGKAVMGTIAVAIRAYKAEKGKTCTLPSGGLKIYTSEATANTDTLGFTDTDLDGTYFAKGDYRLDTSRWPTFSITATPGSRTDAPSTPASMTLTVDGTTGEATWNN